MDRRHSIAESLNSRVTAPQCTHVLDLRNIDDVSHLLWGLVREDIACFLSMSNGRLTTEALGQAAIGAIQATAACFDAPPPSRERIADDWFPAGLARWLRKTTNITEPGHLGAIEVVLGNLVWESRRALQLGADSDWNREQTLNYFECLNIEIAYLLAGVPFPIPEDAPD